MSTIPKGFIGEGKGNMLNINAIVKAETTDKRTIATDVYGIKHYISENQLHKLEGIKL